MKFRRYRWECATHLYAINLGSISYRAFQWFLAFNSEGAEPGLFPTSSISISLLLISWLHEPLARYVKLRVAYAPGMPGSFPHHWQRKPLVSDPDMHHGTCVAHVPWCMLESLTRGTNVAIIWHENDLIFMSKRRLHNNNWLRQIPFRKHVYFASIIPEMCPILLNPDNKWQYWLFNPVLRSCPIFVYFTISVTVLYVVTALALFCNNQIFLSQIVCLDLSMRLSVWWMSRCDTVNHTDWSSAAKYHTQKWFIYHLTYNNNAHPGFVHIYLCGMLQVASPYGQSVMQRHVDFMGFDHHALIFIQTFKFRLNIYIYAYIV